MEMEKGIRALVNSAKRELAMRLRVYPKGIEQGKIKQEQAEHEIACQKVIVRILERIEQFEGMLPPERKGREGEKWQP